MKHWRFKRRNPYEFINGPHWNQIYFSICPLCAFVYPLPGVSPVLFHMEAAVVFFHISIRCKRQKSQNNIWIRDNGICQYCLYFTVFLLRFLLGGDVIWGFEVAFFDSFDVDNVGFHCGDSLAGLFERVKAFKFQPANPVQSNSFRAWVSRTNRAQFSIQTAP